MAQADYFAKKMQIIVHFKVRRKYTEYIHYVCFKSFDQNVIASIMWAKHFANRVMSSVRVPLSWKYQSKSSINTCLAFPTVEFLIFSRCALAK